MKIKNSKENIKLDKLFPVMLGATLVLVVLRCLQLAKYIDSSTGFLTGGSFVNVLFYGIIAASCLYLVIVSFLSKEGGKVELAAFEDKNAGIAAVVFGASLLYDFADSLMDGLAILGNLPFEAYSFRGFRCQILSLYSPMVRSEEKQPE